MRPGGRGLRRIARRGLRLGARLRALGDRAALRRAAAAPISGQRAMRAEVLRELLPFADGYGMEIGMTIDAVRAGLPGPRRSSSLEHRATGRTPARLPPPRPPAARLPTRRAGARPDSVPAR